MNSLLLASANDFAQDFSSFFYFLKDAFASFKVNDAIDILLLTLVFSFALKFLKNRKAGALIIGIGICLVVFIVASVFELSGVRFILSGIFQIGVLAFVIIFQPEIRDLLEKMGSGSIRGLRSIGEQNRQKQLHYKSIDNICKAVRILSVEKTGALIVIERTTQLDDVISTGVFIDAEVSESLLRNLFYNRAPLHDGAVVISGGKIAAAACILPLPTRTAVDNDLGTRHRAAIGISEISDAITIVVSEETGIVSIARETELIRNFTADSLRKYLMREIVRDSVMEDDGKSSGKETLKDNTPED